MASAAAAVGQGARPGLSTQQSSVPLRAKGFTSVRVSHSGTLLATRSSFRVLVSRSRLIRGTDAVAGRPSDGQARAPTGFRKLPSGPARPVAGGPVTDSEAPKGRCPGSLACGGSPVFARWGLEAILVIRTCRDAAWRQRWWRERIPVEEPFGRVGGAARRQAAVWAFARPLQWVGRGGERRAAFVCACAYLSADPASRTRILCARGAAVAGCTARALGAVR